MGPELVHFGGGEKVTPSWQTAGMMHGGGGGPQEVHVHLTMAGDLDDETLWRRMQVVTSNYGTYNSGARTGSWVPH
jgi:hypothetical protein